MTAGPREDTGKILVFALDRTDARVRRRFEAFINAGQSVIGFTFSRRRGALDVPPTWPNYDLGVTRDGHYVGRAIQLVAAIGTVLRHREVLRDVRLLYAINFDNGLIALIASRVLCRRLPIVLEVADIQPAMIGRGIRAKTFRFAERVVLRRTELLVTTSPAFMDHYFRPIQRYGGNYFLLENKVPKLETRPKVESTAKLSRPVVVGYFGALRCHRSWQLIRALARQSRGGISFLMAGYPTFTSLERFAAEVAEHSNIDFLGPYAYPDDLEKLYGQVHLSWAFDFAARGANSSWLLPNRLYESVSMGVPALAERGTETGRWIEKHSAGWSLVAPASDDAAIGSIGTFLERMTDDEWSRVARHVARLEPFLYMQTIDDERQFVATMYAASGPTASGARGERMLRRYLRARRQ